MHRCTHTEETRIVVNAVVRKLQQYLWSCTHPEDNCIVVNAVERKLLKISLVMHSSWGYLYCGECGREKLLSESLVLKRNRNLQF
jgi:hypothetical protein